MKKKVETAKISATEYLANPGKATVLAERVGRVVVTDDRTGQRVLVISSNRATERLLG